MNESVLDGIGPCPISKRHTYYCYTTTFEFQVHWEKCTAQGDELSSVPYAYVFHIHTYIQYTIYSLMTGKGIKYESIINF